jgi:hypothetical protein
MVSRAGRESSNFRAPSVQSFAGRRGLRWCSAPRVWTTQKKKKQEEKEEEKKKLEKEKKERRYAGGFVDVAVACARGDMLLICLNCRCYNYHGTSSG